MKTLTAMLCAMLALTAVACTAGDKIPLPELGDERYQALKSYLDKHTLAPDAYVLSKFEDHDVVILGERHKVKHQLEFVQSLIPDLYEAGVYFLATEFGRREDQPLIDSLLALPVYDEGLAREIKFSQFVHFGYREYVDVYKAAWKLNAGLPDGERKFRILGMNDSPDWSYVKTRVDRDNDEIKKKVWAGTGERLWAGVVYEQVKKGEKVLVHCGMHHGFSQYMQPSVSGNGEFLRFDDSRMGNFLFKFLGKRVITVVLHHPWNDGTYGGELYYPVDGAIDALMARLGEEYYPAGFDTRGSPFGNLPCERSVYNNGYDGLVLGEYCDGYIFIKPLSQHEGVTTIPDFVNDDNIDRARAISWNPDYRDATPAEFYRSAVKDANIPQRYKRLE
jgi:hypothetical protein